MSVLVYTVGTPNGPSAQQVPEQVMHQLRLAHDLRNDFVRAHLDYEARVAAVWTSCPDVAVCEWLLAEAQYHVDELGACLRRERARQRTKRITGDLPKRLVAARVSVREFRAAVKAAKAEVYGEASARFAVLAGGLKAHRKTLYKQYCQDGDLYWASFNAVERHHKAAVKMVNDQRKQGRVAALRFRRWDGTGTLTVQLQRPAGHPPRTPAVLADPGGKYRNILYLPWMEPDVWESMSRADRRRIGRTVVRMRGGSLEGVPQWVDLRVQQHRMPEAAADITGVELTVTKIADETRMRLTVTARESDPEPAAAGATVAIHFGWRRLDAGTLTATWRSDRPLGVPSRIASVLRADPDRLAGAIVLPGDMGEVLDRLERIQSRRNLRVDEIRQVWVAWLQTCGAVAWPGRDGEQLTGAIVRRWTSPRRWAVLSAAFAEHSGAGFDDGLVADLAAWRRWDRRKWSEVTHARRRLIGRRDDLWRNVAVAITDQAVRVVLDDTDIAEMARVGNEALTNEQAAAIGRRRMLAAPAGLRAAVRSAAVRDGVAVAEVSAAGLSRVHARCGFENPADDRYLSRPVRCDGCGGVYDPDRSAVALMLARVSGESAV